MAEKPFLQDCLDARRKQGERENQRGERREDAIWGTLGVWREEERRVDAIWGTLGVFA